MKTLKSFIINEQISDSLMKNYIINESSVSMASIKREIKELNDENDKIISKLNAEAIDAAQAEGIMGGVKLTVFTQRYLGDNFKKTELSTNRDKILQLTKQLEEIQLDRGGFTQKFDPKSLRDLYKKHIYIPDILIAIRERNEQPTVDNYYMDTVTDFVQIIPNSLKELTNDYFIKNEGVEIDKSGEFNNRGNIFDKYYHLINDEITKHWNILKKQGEHTQSPKSSSEYIVMKNGDIYRLSDHWGVAASCTWYLTDIDKNRTTSSLNKAIIADKNYTIVRSMIAFEIGVQNIRNFKNQNFIRHSKLNPELFGDNFLNGISNFIKDVKKLKSEKTIKFTVSQTKQLENVIDTFSEVRKGLKKFKKMSLEKIEINSINNLISKIRNL